MRKLWLIAFLTLTNLCFSNEAAKLDGWELTFSDEFDGDTLDLKKWNPYDPWEVEINGELQAYVRNSFFVKDGILKIRAHKKQAEYDGKMRDYSSGKMTTTGKFAQKYGRFEIRCKMPKGKGLWPAFWMLPDPPSWPPELDVVEFLGHETDMVYLSQHWPKPNDKDDSDSHTKELKMRGTDFTADFHTFALEWEPDEIRWFVDGKLQKTSKEKIPHVPMFMLVNLAVGGGWPGDPDENTKFPAYLEVDYVRAWKRTN